MKNVRQSGYEVILTLLPTRKIKTGDLCRSQIAQRRMRANEVVEKDKHGNKIVGRLERVKALFGLVPGLELFMKCLNQVVGDIVFKRLNADMGGIKYCFNRLLVSGITVRNDRLRVPKVNGAQQGESLRGVSPRREMKPEDKTGFRINDEPDIVLDTTDFNNSFVSMPFIGVEVKWWDKLKCDVMEQRSKAFAPVGNGCMRYLDIVQQAKYKSDFSKRVIADVEQG